MASIVLGTIAAKAGAAYFGVGTAGAIIAGMVGSAAGAYIDQMYVYPAFTDQPDQYGPRLDSASIQTSTEGAPIPWVHGSEIRLAGNIIWVTDLSESANRDGGDKNEPDVTTFAYSINVAVGMAEPPTTAGISKVSKVYANGKLFYDSDNPTVGDDRYSEITFYDGAEDQEPSSIQESIIGEGDVPAYRGLAYMEIQNLTLDDFGNAMPQFQFIIEPETSLTVDTLIARLLSRAGMASSLYTIDAAVNDSVLGMVIPGPVPLRGVLEELMITFNIGVRETAGTLEFYKLDTQQIRGLESGQLLERMQVSRKDQIKLPGNLTVNYKDTSAQLLKGSVTQNIQQSTNTNSQEINLSLSLTPDEARSIAARRLFRLWTERKAATITLPPRYIDVQEGDIHSIDFAGVHYRMRAEEVSFGCNGNVEITYSVMTTIESSPLTPAYQNMALSADDSNVTYPTPYDAQSLELYACIIYIPPITSKSEEMMDAGAYIAQTPVNRDAAVKSVNYYIREYDADAHGSAGEAFTMSKTSTMGELATPLSSTTGRTTHLASDGDFEVSLWGGTLESASEFSVFQGNNLAYVFTLGSGGVAEGEIIGFTDVELVSEHRYKISGIIRGLRDTPVRTHAASEWFVLLDRNQLQFVNWWIGWRGTLRKAQIVPTGTSFSFTPGERQEFATVFEARNLEPFAPGLISGTRDGMDNLTLTWFRRTRRIWATLSEVTVPIDDDPETYAIEIMDGSTVVRTYEVTGERTVTYPAAYQITDFGSIQSSVTTRVYQVSQITGRGNYREETV